MHLIQPEVAGSAMARKGSPSHYVEGVRATLRESRRISKAPRSPGTSAVGGRRPAVSPFARPSLMEVLPSLIASAARSGSPISRGRGVSRPTGLWAVSSGQPGEICVGSHQPLQAGDVSGGRRLEGLSRKEIERCLGLLGGKLPRRVTAGRGVNHRPGAYLYVRQEQEDRILPERMTFS